MGCNGSKTAVLAPEASGKAESSRPLLLGNEGPQGNLKAHLLTTPSTNTPSPRAPEATVTGPGIGATDEDSLETANTLELDRSEGNSPCHFSPLSIVGVWHYNGRERNTKYKISISGDCLRIQQMVANECHEGFLSPAGEWLVGDVKKTTGQIIGTIRLKHHGGTLVSNFKVPGGQWGVDLIANRDVTMPLSPSAMCGAASQEDESAGTTLLSSQPPAAAKHDKVIAAHETVNQTEQGNTTKEMANRPGQSAQKGCSQQAAMCPSRREKQLCCC